MTTTISVGIMGFSAQEQHKLKKIFELSQQHPRSYQLSSLADIEPVQLLIIKEGDEAALRQQQAYQARYENTTIPIVIAGREPIATKEDYYIRGGLVPSRVFSVLDKIEIPTKNNPIVIKAEENWIAEPDNQPSIIAEITDVLHVADALYVLVVDDSEMMQKTVQLELNKVTIPLVVDFADTGETALEKIKLKKYDFIFLDVVMPGIDGFETCSQIRKREGMVKTPIVMLTSKNSAMDEVKGLMAGCSTYLTKPFDHDEFQKMLERIVYWVKEFNEGK